MKKVLAILAYEKDYVNELAEYLGTRKDFDFDVLTFSGSEQLKNYEEKHDIDMLLCDEEIALTSASEYRTKNICILSDYSFISERVKYPGIFKYQSADAVMKEIIRYYSKHELSKAAEEAVSLGNRRICCVCSPVGGAYKSTFALALAVFYAKRGRTLFLSLDPFFCVPKESKKPEEKNLTDVIYYLEQACREPVAFIASLTKKADMLEYINGVSHWYDLYDFEAKHARRLISSLYESDYYDSIIIDLGIMGQASLEFLLGCDKVYIPIREGNVKDEEKYNEWIRQLSFVSGEHNIDKAKRVSVPYDENLDNINFDIETLKNSELNEFISKLEGEI